MKKEYIKPLAELIEFQPKDSLMDVLNISDEMDTSNGAGIGGDGWMEG